MKEKLQAILQKVKAVILGYPMVLLMSFTMAITIVLMMENEWKLREDFTPMRIIITASLGISLMFAIKMLSQRAGREWLWHVLGVLLLAGYYFILPDTDKAFTDVYVFVIFPSTILSHLLVAFVPFLGKDQELKFWQYNKNLFINFFLTMVFTGVLTGGVELAIVAVNELFNLDFEDEVFGETFFMLAIFGNTFIFLLFNEKGLEQLEKDGTYPVVLKFFTQFILIPLLFIYVVILYFYSGKILLNWELPEGWVSYLVLAYSIIGILALLLVHPLKADTAKSWVRIFSRIFYFTLFPLIVLLFTAIFTRLLEYGFTEARYFVLLLAVWLLCVVLYFTVVKNPTIKFIPVSLFSLGLFALVFPYFNTFSVAKRSQKHELENILAANNLLINGKIDFDKKISSEVVANISDKFTFLSERLEYEYLSNLMQAKEAKTFADDQKWYINALFKNVSAVDVGKETWNVQLRSKTLTHKTTGYDVVIRQSDLDTGEVMLGKDKLTLKTTTYSTKPFFELTLNGREKTDFGPMIKNLLDKYRGSEGLVKTDSLSVEGDLGHYHIKVIFSQLGTNIWEKEVNYSFGDGLILVREK